MRMLWRWNNLDNIHKMVVSTCSYQSVIIHTQCYATSEECGYTTHGTFKWLQLPIWKSYCTGTVVDPCNATPVEIWSVDNHHWSISVHLLGSRSWMTRLTLASEGSGSLSKLQPLHELLHLRSGCHWGYMCRMLKNKRWEVVEISILCKVYLVSVSHYWDTLSDTVCQFVS